MDNSLCAKCNVCEQYVPVQDKDRVLVLEPEDSGHARILVIDDAQNQDEYDLSMAVAYRLLGTTQFAYTCTVRCDHVWGKLGADYQGVVTARCAVWSNLVAEDRALLVATKRALVQLKVGADKAEGDVFRVPKLGLVLCIPPLLTLKSNLSAYKRRAERVLHEAGVLA